MNNNFHCKQTKSVGISSVLPKNIEACGIMSQVVRVPALGETQVSDATGAGDLFASGFLYGLLKGLSLEDCCKVGSCSGGSVIRSLGGDVSQENRHWMYKQMQIKGLSIPELGL